MKQLIQNLKTGELRLKEVSYPLCKSDGVIVKTVNSLISLGTEKSIIELAQKSLLGKTKARPDLFKRALQKAKKEGFWKVFKESMRRLDEPFSLGYSASGIVVKVGEGVRNFAVGDRAAIAGSSYANHAEYNFVPENLCFKIPKRKNNEYLDFEEAAFCMLGGISLQGLRVAELEARNNDYVAVIGLGLLGLLTIQILKGLGYKVVGLDINDRKINFAKKLGCQYCVNTKKEDAEELVMSLTGNQGVEGVLITAAARDNTPLQLAQKITGRHARIVLVGVCDIHLERKYFWDKELIFKVSKAAGSGEFERNNIEEFLNLVTERKVNVKDLITHRFAFEDIISAYKMLLKGREYFIAVMLDYQKSNLQAANRLIESKIINKQAKVLMMSKNKKKNIGLIGAGNFAKNVLLPALIKIKDVNLIGIATTRGITSEHMASKFSFKYSTTNYKEILEDQNIGSVFVITRHNLHSKFVIEALSYGKDVFVEKPLCLNKDELFKIEDAFKKSSGDLMVGFNRRYSMQAKEIRDFFDKDEPFVINYRINAGFIDSSHWTQDIKEGGGRIIGEVCHFVDLLQFITSSEPVKVYTEGISGSNNFRADDNIISVIKFQDGSLANITYTSKGSKSYPREILEIYQKNSVYYLEDFRTAIKIKGHKKKRKKLLSQDMGYKEELQYFFSDWKNKTDIRSYVINSLTVFAMLESLKTAKSIDIGLI